MMTLAAPNSRPNDHNLPRHRLAPFRSPPAGPLGRIWGRKSSYPADRKNAVMIYRNSAVEYLLAANTDAPS